MVGPGSEVFLYVPSWASDPCPLPMHEGDPLIAFVASATCECSHTGFEKPHEIALELVYRVENRGKSIGARAGGLFQAFLRPIWLQNLDFQTKAFLTALEIHSHSQHWVATSRAKLACLHKHL
jgi:hypothetical protein